MALPRYYIPSELKNAIKDNAAFVEGNNIRNKFLRVLKKLKNIDCLEIAECHYFQFLKLGLYLEEYQQRIDTTKQFQINGTKIEKVPDSAEKFKIYVKNLDQSNPLLNVSDLLIAYEQNKRKTDFFLTVVKVCEDHVIVAATKKFCKLYSELTKYSIELKFNTYWFQCCHYALTAVNSLMISHYIFPEKSPAISHDLNYHQTWFNKDVLNNPNQKQAVSNIVKKSSFPAPYILYGPPGTGKTSTLVEAICQSWEQSDDYILICAPSNAACDVVTKRLLDYIPFTNLYRLYSRTEEYSRIDEDIKKCCNFKDIGKVDEIREVVLSCKKIIITTLCTSLRLEKLKLPFSHVFIDEGGQATLTDVMLPLCALKFSRNFQIVISGDHKQLGPCIRSKLAEPLLGQSILEKLMKHDPYKKDPKTGYDPRYITKLIRNFRSTEEIIHVSNVLFYDSELIACSNNTKLGYFPVIFWGVEGEEMKCPHSTSSYNDAEINIVLFMVKSFIGEKAGDKIIGREDIGIVTPFKLQVSKMREKLNDAGLNEISVGTVETYQGQEKEVILISTVRSKTFIHDGVRHIGFLSNPKRFNVALTRAKSLLVVVGSPSALKTDKYWRYFLRFCQENNSCQGDSFILKDEIFFKPSQESNIGSRNKKSTDLFDKTFTILKIDDGVLYTSKNNHISSRRTSSCTTDISNTSMTNAYSNKNTPVPLDITSAPTSSINSVSSTAVISDSMKKPMSSINAVPKSAAPTSGIVRNSSMAISGTRNIPTSGINSVPNAAVTTGIMKTPMSSINPMSNSINPSMKNLNSIRNSSVAAGSTSHINSVQNASLRSDNVYTLRINAEPTRRNISEIHCRKPNKNKKKECFRCCIL